MKSAKVVHDPSLAIGFPLGTTLPLEQAWWSQVVRDVSKRLLDVIVAATLLTVLFPLLLLVAAIIWLDSPGSVLFRQTRVGKDGNLFNMWKFRSLCADAEEKQPGLEKVNQMAGGVIFKIKDDPRVTRVGRFIRKTSIDEIPQLWNVLIGNMSMVGPRPALPREVYQYSPYERRRLEAIPGITCIWQVSGRSDVPFKKQVEMDIAYIKSQSLWLDASLLFKTIPAVLSRHGAY